MGRLLLRSPGSRASLRRRQPHIAFCRASPRSSSSLTYDQAGDSELVKGLSMLFVTRWFGVTGSDAERNLDAEQACIDEIVKKVLLLQANAAAQQHRPLGRGTHAKG